MRKIGWGVALVLSLGAGFLSGSASRPPPVAPVPGVVRPVPCPPVPAPLSPRPQEKEALPSFEEVVPEERPEEAMRRLQEIVERVGDGVIAEVECSEHPCIAVITFEGSQGADAVVQAFLEEATLEYGSSVSLGKAAWNAHGGYAVFPLAAASSDLRWLRRLNERMSDEDDVFAVELQEGL
jgi:hypothetical protein